MTEETGRTAQDTTHALVRQLRGELASKDEFVEGCTGQPTFDVLESEIPDGDSQQLILLKTALTAGSRLRSGRSAGQAYG